MRTRLEPIQETRARLKSPYKRQSVLPPLPEVTIKALKEKIEEYERTQKSQTKDQGREEGTEEGGEGERKEEAKEGEAKLHNDHAEETR